MNAQQQFEKVVSSSFDTLSSEDLKPLALGLWYEDYVPELNGLGLVELQKAGYLLDLFASFNCVSENRQLELMELTKEIKQNLSDFLEQMESCYTLKLEVDVIAQEWCLTEDVSEAVHDLLKYQTRHYVHV
jgi:hypothetical protein